MNIKKVVMDFLTIIMLLSMSIGSALARRWRFIPT